ncbi:MAG: hypothetical protein M0D55_19440 [Elusimicrobiota bacterium]|nr:MAG: hypothetical protein M0D55_19440 [Elusimicrobiota bacterium]
MKILVPVVLALLSPAASAENRPFNTANGRTTKSSSPAPQAAQSASGGAAANGPAVQAAAPARAGVTVYGPGSMARVSGGRSLHGGRGSGGGRSFGYVGARRAGGSGAGQAASGVGARQTAEEAPPPNFSKPGALIRDTGQAPVYNQGTVGTHSVDAGEIVMNKRKAFNVATAPSVHIGPKDTPPPPNPGNPGSYTGSGAAPNGAAPNGSSGSGSGGDNNGSGNNGKDKPGDDDDGKGGDKARESSFYDAF